MRAFADLFDALDQTTKTNEKVSAMAHYFQVCLSDADDTPPRTDAAWAIAYLSGRRAKRLIPTTALRQWAAKAAGIPDWLFDESYDRVGDLAETITLIVPGGDQPVDRSLTCWVEDHVLPLSKMDEPARHDAVRDMWRHTDGTSRLILMKLITGAFRLGVGSRMVARGIAESTGIPADVIAHRLMGHWKPGEPFLTGLISPDIGDAAGSRPYPFCLAHAIPPAAGSDDDSQRTDDSPGKTDPEAAGLDDPSRYVAEWKWDGIRGQVIRRDGQTFIWSRGEELMMDRWPEVERAAEFLPDGTVIDGEILASRLVNDNVEVLPFAQLQRRIGRKTVGKKLLAEVPVMFHAFDCLEWNGQDIRDRSLEERLRTLRELVAQARPPHVVVHPPVQADDWSAMAKIRQRSREFNAEGLMLKRLDSTYHVGRARGSWWKWKVTPHTVDAVLIYAQRGHGKRASLYTDYTFAVWDGDQLVPFAKAYSGLTDAEINRVDRFIRQNTTQRFGPVRSVTPELVMELAFEGLQRSTRHKSGIATRFPRIVRWREDKKPVDADKLADLLAMLD